MLYVKTEYQKWKLCVGHADLYFGVTSNKIIIILHNAPVHYANTACNVVCIYFDEIWTPRSRAADITGPVEIFRKLPRSIYGKEVPYSAPIETRKA